MIVKDLVARNASFRAALSRDAEDGYLGLVPLEDLRARPWDYSAPTLVAPPEPEKQKPPRLCLDSRVFAHEFHKRFPIFRAVSLDGIVIVGGAVAQFVCEYEWAVDDIDVYVWGDDPDKRIRTFINELEAAEHALQRKCILDELLALRGKTKPSSTECVDLVLQIAKTGSYSVDQDRVHIAKPPEVDGVQWRRALKLVEPHARTSYQLPAVVTIRTKESITIHTGSMRIRISLSQPGGVSEVLHASDFDLLAVGYDGRNVWLTELGSFVHTTKFMVARMPQNASTYASSLMAYFERGFGLILPDLGMNTLPTRNLAYGYPEIARLPSMVFAFNRIEDNKISFVGFLGVQSPVSDIASPESIVDENIRSLIAGVDAFIYAEKSNGYGCARRVLSAAPYLSHTDLLRVCDAYRKACWDGQYLNVALLEWYVPAVGAFGVVSRVFQGKEDINKVLDEVFDRQKDNLERLWHNRVKCAPPAKPEWRPMPGETKRISLEAWYGEHVSSVH